MINIGSKNSLIVARREQTEVINKNSEDLNQTKRMPWARVRKRAPSWGEVVSKANQAKNKYFLDFDKIWGDTNRNLSLPKSVNIQRGNNE